MVCVCVWIMNKSLRQSHTQRPSVNSGYFGREGEQSVDFYFAHTYFFVVAKPMNYFYNLKKINKLKEIRSF